MEIHENIFATSSEQYLFVFQILRSSTTWNNNSEMSTTSNSLDPTGKNYFLFETILIIMSLNLIILLTRE